MNETRGARFVEGTGAGLRINTRVFRNKSVHDVFVIKPFASSNEKGRDESEKERNRVIQHERTEEPNDQSV